MKSTGIGERRIQMGRRNSKSMIAETTGRKSHWENIHSTKKSNEVSWYQEIPSPSLELIRELNLPLTAHIFDNGGGDSTMADHLLRLGYTNITVQDISENALNKAKQRLGEDAKKINWILGDEACCNLDEPVDVWHDRAAFHFLTDQTEISNCLATISRCIRPGGYFIIGTFSENGPEKCSGLPVRRYSGQSMEDLLDGSFTKIKCFTTDHRTPSDKIQNFLFCVFRRNSD